MQTITILSQYEGEAIAKLTKLAKRAKRYGQTIAWTTRQFTTEATRVRWDGKKMTVTIARTEFSLEGEAPRVGNYTFLAQLERHGDGVLISGRGEVGDMGRAWKGECQHCGLKRNRSAAYVVQDADGNKVIVGKSCLRDHLGIDAPAGVLARFQWEREIDNMGDEDEGGWGGYGRWEEDTLGVVAASRAAIALWGWSPKGNDIDGGKSTASRVSLILNPRNLKGQNLLDYQALMAEMKANGPHYQETAEQVVEWAKTLDPRSDYEHNLKLAASTCFVTLKTFGLVVSAAAAFDRQKARENELAAKRASEAEKNKDSEWFGEIKQRLTADLTVERKVALPDYGFGPSTIIVMRTADGSLVSWKTGTILRINGRPLEIGDKFLAKFTIKSHADYKGVRETRVSRLVQA